MEFAVVKFSKDGTSEIPVKWIIGDGNKSCWWPYKRIKNFSALIQKKVDPKDDWNVEEITKVEFCDTYFLLILRKFTSTKMKIVLSSILHFFHKNPN